MGRLEVARPIIGLNGRHIDQKSVELLRLTAKSPRAWALLPYALARVEHFVSRYDAESHAPSLVKNISLGFASDSESLGLWLAMTPERGAVGHAVASIEKNDLLKKTWVFVLQVETDLALSATLKGRFVSELEEFGRANGASYIEAWTPHNPRLWRRYGFKFHRNVLRREL